MKKIVSCILFAVLILSLAFSLLACEETGYKEYTECGLNFRLPKDFRKFTVQGADIHYSTPDATFEVQYMPKSEFESTVSEDGGLGMDFNMTVREYTEFLIEENGWQDPGKTEQYTYDETRDAAMFYILWTPDFVEFPYSYYYFTIMKSESAFYAVMFICEESKVDEYKDKFTAWSTYLSVIG